nr:unnamed protein product [Digitaria exilis]
MEFPPPLFGSSPRTPVPSRPMHGQGTGAPTGPPPPLLASSPQPAQTPLNGQATGAPMETPAPAAPAPFPRPYTVERIFRDFCCRRAALIRALTKGEKTLVALASRGSKRKEVLHVKAFSHKCNTGAESLYLYVNRDESWELRPKMLMQPEQPDPTMLGIKIARKRLSAMMKSLQTVHATFIASDTYRRICHLEKMNEDIEDEDEGCGDEPTKCGVCGDHYRANAFWIGCDVCDRWFHGKCVNVTSAEAEHIGQYECPECFCEKKGHDYNADPMLSALYKSYS